MEVLILANECFSGRSSSSGERVLAKSLLGVCGSVCSTCLGIIEINSWIIKIIRVMRVISVIGLYGVITVITSP